MKTCSKCGNFKPFDQFKTVKPGKGDRFNLASHCRECEREANRLYHAKNKEKIAARKVKTNGELYKRKRNEIIARCTKYQKENMHVSIASQMRRSAIKKRSLVAWANEIKIAEVYAACPDGMHVDHIVPLQGKLVTGLHVHNNLQYLTPSENMSKSNRWDPMEDSKQFDSDLK